MLHVHLSEPAQRLTCENLAKHQLALNADKAELRRTYHLGTEPTTGRGYDDRLTVRLGLSRSTLMQQLELYRTGGGKTGGLRFAWAGKYMVSEAACREWLLDKAPGSQQAARVPTKTLFYSCLPTRPRRPRCWQ